jgi:hypothetical protein
MFVWKKETPVQAFKFVVTGEGEHAGDNFEELRADVEKAGGTAKRSEGSFGATAYLSVAGCEAALGLNEVAVLDGSGLARVLPLEAFHAGYAEMHDDGLDLDALVADVKALQGKVELLEKAIEFLKAAQDKGGKPSKAGEPDKAGE